MHLRKALTCVAKVPWPDSFDDLRRHIDPEWIHEALEATGTATLRRRRLPAEQVIWLVLGMALMRDRSIVEIVDSLDLALPVQDDSALAQSSVTQARSRLGEEPMAWLFDTCARKWAHASAARHRWRGLALYGVDGSTLRVWDSEENRQHFTLAKGERGEAAYPQLRLAMLAALRSHLLAAAAIGPYTVGEGTLAAELWAELPDDSLCIVDRNFLHANVLVPLARDGANRHWLVRAKKSTVWKQIEQLGKDELLVEMKVSPAARRADPSLPQTWMARAIRYQRPGFQPQWLLTSMLDRKQHPAREIAELYHERWELEQGYDEIKTEMLDREETIRSRSPERVRQEVWGVLLAFNLVRLEMERLAEQVKVEPTSISFVVALHLIRDEWLLSTFASPGAIPRHLKKLRENLRRLVLPPRRSKRAYPRAVKIKMSSYPKKHRSGGREAAK